MKKIGIVSSLLGSNVGIPSTYVHFLSQFGKVVFVDALNDEIDETLDLLVLPGGADVNPARYNEMPSPLCGKSNLFLEHFDVHILPKYIDLIKKKRNFGIFGICRGSQTLNVSFGGKLTQHKRLPVSRDRYDLVDELIIVNNNFNKRLESEKINNILNTENAVYRTNSLHHQCYEKHQLSNKLEALAIDSTYGHVEAFRHKTLKIAGVQWHPEEMDNPIYSIAIINHILHN